MRRVFGWMLALVVAAVTIAGPGRAAEFDVERLSAPESIGDQVIFYYDARADFTTFVNLRNTSNDELTVSVLFYGPTFGTPFSQAVVLPGGALKVIDVGALRGAGLPAQAGVAFATAVDRSGSPLVTRALTGNFTVANLLTGSAFGAPAAARSAVTDSGARPILGIEITGGRTAVLQAIAPSTAVLAAYYDPSDLAPVQQSGNQLIFINFVDGYDAGFNAGIGSTTWEVTTVRGNGSGISVNDLIANGVTVTDLASVAGVGVNGATGSMTFMTELGPQNQTRLIYFTESLGTFGTGYLLPPLPR